MWNPFRPRLETRSYTDALVSLLLRESSVTGTSPDPSRWTYRVGLYGPDGSVTRTVPSAGIVHIRYSVAATWLAGQAPSSAWSRAGWPFPRPWRSRDWWPPMSSLHSTNAQRRFPKWGTGVTSSDLP